LQQVLNETVVAMGKKPLTGNGNNDQPK